MKCRPNCCPPAASLLPSLNQLLPLCRPQNSAGPNGQCNIDEDFKVCNAYVTIFQVQNLTAAPRHSHCRPAAQRAAGGGTFTLPDKAAFFAKSQGHFNSVKSAGFDFLPGCLPESGFMDGETAGEDDFHVSAWLTRIAALNGAKLSNDAVVTMGAAFGSPVPGKVAAYWEAWIAKTSWKKVYAGGMH
ncbi:hypothetical protein B0H14DRAFT_2633957 [Mycena olivaceomarginata]|nr:hypothetical protein B0H14DRAFT_2633957 [Mycena olivaceomarginata]